MKLLNLILLLCFINFLYAGESELRAKIESQYPEISVSSIKKTEFNDLYEVLIGDQIIYTDEAFSFLVVGKIIDPKTKDDLTQARVDELTKIDFKKLPFHNSIKIVKGNGKRKLAVFSDVDCPFCKKLEKETFSKLENVTIYTFLYPLDIHPNAEPKSINVWCAKDKVRAWNELMIKNKMPDNDNECSNPIQDTIQLGKTLGITATPTIILSDGKKIPGAVDIDYLEEELIKRE